MTTSEQLKKMKTDDWKKFNEIYKSNTSEEIKKEIFKDFCQEFFLFGTEDFKNQMGK